MRSHKFKGRNFQNVPVRKKNGGGVWSKTGIASSLFVMNDQKVFAIKVHVIVPYIIQCYNMFLNPLISGFRVNVFFSMQKGDQYT